MKLTFKSEEFGELNFVRDYADGFDVIDADQIRETVHHVDFKGIRTQTHRIYCPGMIVSMMEGSLENDLVQILEGDFPYMQMHFELNTTGCFYYPDAAAEIDTEIYGGTHSILYYPALHGKLHYLKKPHSQSVEIELSVDFLRRIFHNDLEILREFGKNIEASHPAIMGSRSFPITSEMRHILNQIRNCALGGILKRLFVEAKVIELLTLQIAQINALSKTKKTLKKQDIDKLNEVRDILNKNIYTPYSIEELSRLAGINRTKLQEGFKDLFGNTIFGYITDVRLEEARRQILNSHKDDTISEIAAKSGYKNPQHFTAAFKRKFGYLPRDVKK
jgi:AraC family transcriptional regulator, transcriptional activator of the genes for pyochelin and ferripyochelin receptors